MVMNANFSDEVEATKEQIRIKRNSLDNLATVPVPTAPPTPCKTEADPEETTTTSTTTLEDEEDAAVAAAAVVSTTVQFKTESVNNTTAAITTDTNNNNNNVVVENRVENELTKEDEEAILAVVGSLNPYTSKSFLTSLADEAVSDPLAVLAAKSSERSRSSFEVLSSSDSMIHFPTHHSRPESAPSSSTSLQRYGSPPSPTNGFFKSLVDEQVDPTNGTPGFDSPQQQNRRGQLKRRGSTGSLRVSLGKIAFVRRPSFNFCNVDDAVEAPQPRSTYSLEEPIQQPQEYQQPAVVEPKLVNPRMAQEPEIPILPTIRRRGSKTVARAEAEALQVALADLEEFADYLPPPPKVKSILKKPNRPQRPERNVVFDCVEIRVYNRVAERNPSVSCGPPIGLGWDYNIQERTHLEYYEEQRDERRIFDELIIPVDERLVILHDEWGVSYKELEEAMQDVKDTQRERRGTFSLTELELARQVMERASRTWKRFLRRTSAQGEQRELWENARNIALKKLREAKLARDSDDDDGTMSVLTTKTL